MNLNPLPLREHLPLLALFLLLPLLACSNPSLSPEHSEHSATWLEHRFGTIEDRDTGRLLNRILLRLSDSTTLPEVRDWISTAPVEQPWQIAVLRSAEPNALSVGGGRLFVTQGLFAALHTEAELAAVLSHEMAHDLLGHQAVAYQRAAKGSHPAVSYNIQEEINADALGALLLNRAGYEPAAALSALTLFYRSPRREVSQKMEQEFEKRTAELRSRLAESIDVGPTTENSREYNRVRRALLARPPVS